MEEVGGERFRLGLGCANLEAEGSLLAESESCPQPGRLECKQLPRFSKGTRQTLLTRQIARQRERSATDAERKKVDEGAIELGTPKRGK